MLYMTYGPDGQVWVIDWYDMQQCHLREPDKHDRSNGRIYRIVYDNAKPVQVDLQKLSDEELVKLLTHDNEWYRAACTANSPRASCVNRTQLG